MEASEILAQTVDKSQVPPLHQKRIVAFINHFLISSCSFLNEFSGNCETKFIELERKMQKIEAALTIIEAKLASIPDADVKIVNSNEAVPTATTTGNPTTAGATLATNSEASMTKETTETNSTDTNENVETEEAASGVRACDDERYKKFFKMVKFGVPPEAVKVKMQVEGLVASILDTPNMILPDGISS